MGSFYLSISVLDCGVREKPSFIHFDASTPHSDSHSFSNQLKSRFDHSPLIVAGQSNTAADRVSPPLTDMYVPFFCIRLVLHAFCGMKSGRCQILHDFATEAIALIFINGFITCQCCRFLHQEAIICNIISDFLRTWFEFTPSASPLRTRPASSPPDSGCGV